MYDEIKVQEDFYEAFADKFLVFDPLERIEESEDVVTVK